MDIIERIQKTTNRISSIFTSNWELEKYLSSVDQIIQYLVITSPVVAQYRDQFGDSEIPKKEEKTKLIYEDLPEEKALDFIKRRDEDITLVSSEKESSEEEDDEDN